MGDSLTLEFSREVLIIDGFPILGTVEVEVTATDASFCHEHGTQHETDVVTTVEGFEPEDGRTGLLWSDVGPACEEWLRENWTRVQERAFKRS